MLFSCCYNIWIYIYIPYVFFSFRWSSTAFVPIVPMGSGFAPCIEDWKPEDQPSHSEVWKPIFEMEIFKKNWATFKTHRLVDRDPYNGFIISLSQYWTLKTKKCLNGVTFSLLNIRHPKKFKPFSHWPSKVTFHYTGWLIGILIMVYYGLLQSPY